MRTLSIALVLVIATTVAACEKLYFDDKPANGNLGAPDAGTYPNGDAGLSDSYPVDADNSDGGCGGGGADAGWPQPDAGGDAGTWYPDAGPCCNTPPDAL